MRAFLMVLDSLGIGAAPDAEAYGDGRANTLGHIADACARGEADRPGIRAGSLKIPNLASLGLVHAACDATSMKLPIDEADEPIGRFGYAAEVSRGKDTPSGHWEMTGLPVTFDWGFFPRRPHCFPEDLIAAIIAADDLPGVLGECHASGTQIIAELGAEHVRSGKPILYTSGDSVVQIAAHEQHFGLQRLYALCESVRILVDPLNIGRVIARPFVGDPLTGFSRTTNRRDYVTPPHGPTLLDVVARAGRDVIAIGKVSDIFAHRGITRSIKAGSNREVFDAVRHCLTYAKDGALVVANFNDFDTLFGHRRDTAGYAAALEVFDAWLGELLLHMRHGDLFVLSADHGCDPTQPGSDHTREFVPVLLTGSGISPASLGMRRTFADVGQSIATHLGLPPLDHGTCCLSA